MKVKSKRMYFVLLIILIYIPCFMWLIWGEGLDSVNYENRMPAERPSFDTNAYGSYFIEYESYFNDHLPLRNKMIFWNSWINYCIFGVPTSDRVIAGKEKWLFYGDVSDGNPVGDYEGTDSFSAEEINQMCETSLNVQNRLEEMGICFAVIIPTNKERIYAEYMPDYYTYSEASKTDLMIEALQEKNVHIINPKESLLNQASQYQLYYSYDTHWNQLGGYVAVCDILKPWKIKTERLTDLSILSSELSENYHVCAEDDLANMLNLRDSVFYDEIEYTIKENYEVDWSQLMYASTYFNNKAAVNDEKVLLLGDSFRAAMIPALCTYFSEVYVVHHSSYTYDLLKEISPDYLIVEYVERHSDSLKELEYMLFGE